MHASALIRTPTPHTFDVLDTVSEPEAARLLGCCARHLKGLRLAGDAPAHLRVGRAVRYPRTAVALWAAQKLSTAPRTF